ncbi:hypothetical protein KI809_17545 [Geobacter pelophilus]|jgi:hypothetical protein|uniref:Uncharacterized protein n=1 Tax=Geoanaerobacter pelophilus TaxID=60036 RepID=A0AAW4L5Q6_9BACT|nr:hypothetical protein [Geoanaerobacter pelophilus]MBT0666119.1 hypothetical protein [Geoanaerobacter pelophilus]
MDPNKFIIKYKRKKPKLLNPITDEQQSRINDSIDQAEIAHLNLNPTDPRAIPYVRQALWLWK